MSDDFNLAEFVRWLYLNVSEADQSWHALPAATPSYMWEQDPTDCHTNQPACNKLSSCSIVLSPIVISSVAGFAGHSAQGNRRNRCSPGSCKVRDQAVDGGYTIESYLGSSRKWSCCTWNGDYRLFRVESRKTSAWLFSDIDVFPVNVETRCCDACWIVHDCVFGRRYQYSDFPMASCWRNQ